MKLVAIDIGTTKINVLVSTVTPEGTCDIIGVGQAPSQGLARGVVVDVYSACQSIATAIKEAERSAGCRIESAAIGISGSHIQSYNSHGVISIQGETIEQKHLDAVKQVAIAVSLPAGQQLLHALPIWYIVDGHEQVLDPRGMMAVRLEVHMHLITGAVGSVHNLIRCTELAGIKVHDVILEPLASACAVLHPEERQLGVAVLDIGGGTSDFAIYQQGTIRHTKVYPIAGNLFTQDIALILRTTTAEAERLKKMYGHVQPSQDPALQTVSAHRVDGQTMVSVEPAWLYEILDARLTELAGMIQQDIARFNLQRYMPAGIVVTGGGSLLTGLADRLQLLLNMPVRLGAPLVNGTFSSVLQHPMHATGMGLLTLSMHQELQRRSASRLPKFLPQTVFARMRSWIFDFM